MRPHVYSHPSSPSSLPLRASFYISGKNDRLIRDRLSLFLPTAAEIKDITALASRTRGEKIQYKTNIGSDEPRIPLHPLASCFLPSSFSYFSPAPRESNFLMGVWNFAWCGCLNEWAMIDAPTGIEIYEIATLKSDCLTMEFNNGRANFPKK